MHIAFAKAIHAHINRVLTKMRIYFQVPTNITVTEVQEELGALSVLTGEKNKSVTDIDHTVKYMDNLAKALTANPKDPKKKVCPIQCFMCHLKLRFGVHAYLFQLIDYEESNGRCANSYWKFTIGTFERPGYTNNSKRG